MKEPRFRLGLRTSKSRPIPVWVGLLSLALVLSCSRAEQTVSTPDPATRLRAIPAANPKTFQGGTATKNWKNPYLIVRDDGIGLVDLSNNEIHILKPDEVPAALAQLPSSAWPYGRVVAVEEGETPAMAEATKVEIRKNRALLAGTLEELKIAISWIASGTKT